MNLVIVESPTKTKTLSKFLGMDYRIAATMGHIRDLPKSKIGVDVDHDFKPQYDLVKGKEKAVEELKKLAEKADKIWLATDLDREGEAIAWHTMQILGYQDIRISREKKKKKHAISQYRNIPMSRITFHEITKTAIKKALANPGKINMPLVHAQQARRILDRLVGYKLSPLLWRKIRRGLSAGRVQSVVVRLIVEKEREIEKFVPEEYWEIMAELRRGASTFLAKLVKKNNKQVKIANEITSKDTVAELKKADWEVNDIERKETLQSPPPPFKTSTLQQKAAQTLRFSSRRTMRLAQSLYEKGLITYHRTDSLTLASQALVKVRNFIDKNFGQNYLPEQPRFYKTKSKVAQEAHEAIRPTSISKQPKDITGLRQDEQKLYQLIWKRTLSCQMTQAIWDKTKVKIHAAGKENLYEFLIEGKIVKFDGWLKVYNLGHSEETNNQLPDLNRGDDLDLIKLLPEQKFTQPPARYTEASLIKILEEKGIGRPSTYAPTISTVQNRQYVEKIERKFHATPLGITVNDFLLEYFPELFDYEFTATMEDDLDKIASGKKKWVPVIREFWDPFIKKLEAVTQIAKRVAVPTEVTGEKCPKCAEEGLPANRRGNLVIRIGRFGKFISCSRFPDCRYTAPFNRKLEGVVCEKCGGDVVVRKTKKGKQFYGCSNWPKCKWASWRKPNKIST